MHFFIRGDHSSFMVTIGAGLLFLLRGARTRTVGASVVFLLARWHRRSRGGGQGTTSDARDSSRNQAEFFTRDIWILRPSEWRVGSWGAVPILGETRSVDLGAGNTLLSANSVHK